MFLLQRRRKTENEKEENISRRKLCFFAEKKMKEGKVENIWRRETYFLAQEKNNRKGKGEQNLEWENIFFLWRRRKTKFGEGKYIFC